MIEFIVGFVLGYLVAFIAKEHDLI